MIIPAFYDYLSLHTPKSLKELVTESIASNPKKFPDSSLDKLPLPVELKLLVMHKRCGFHAYSNEVGHEAILMIRMSMLSKDE